jgi:hypothetical protein
MPLAELDEHQRVLVEDPIRLALGGREFQQREAILAAPGRA